MIPAIPPKYRLPILALVALSSLFGVIVCFISIARMGDIAKNARSVELGGLREDPEADADKQRAENTQLLLSMLAGFFIFLFGGPSAFFFFAVTAYS